MTLKIKNESPTKDSILDNYSEEDDLDREDLSEASPNQPLQKAVGMPRQAVMNLDLGLNDEF